MAGATSLTGSSPSWWSASSASLGSTRRSWPVGATRFTEQIFWNICLLSRLYTHKMICKMMQFKVREQMKSHSISLFIFQGWAEGEGEHPIGLHPAGQLHLRYQLVHPQLHVQWQRPPWQAWQVIETLTSLWTLICMCIFLIFCQLKIKVKTELWSRHNKTGGLYNYSDPSIYDPTFDTVFNGPSINPCKLVILQTSVCQVFQHHSASIKSFCRSSGSARPSFPSSFFFGASWWLSCWSSQLRIWTATWKGVFPCRLSPNLLSPGRSDSSGCCKTTRNIGRRIWKRCRTVIAQLRTGWLVM